MGEFTKELSVPEVLGDGGEWAKAWGEGRCHLMVSV